MHLYWSKLLYLLSVKLTSSQLTSIWIFMINTSAFGDFSLYFFSFIYFLGYPGAHTNGQEYALLLLNLTSISFFCLLYFNPIPLVHFSSIWQNFFPLHPSRIPKPPMKNHLYTLSFLFAILHFFCNETGQAVHCAGYHYSVPRVLWKHLTSPYVISRMYFPSLSNETGQEFG